MIKIMNEVNFDRFNDDPLGDSWADESWETLRDDIKNYCKENGRPFHMFKDNGIVVDFRHYSIVVLYNEDKSVTVVNEQEDDYIDYSKELDASCCDFRKFGSIEAFVTNSGIKGCKSVFPGINLKCDEE